MAQRFAAITVTILLIGVVVDGAAFGTNCQGSSQCSGRGNAKVRLRDAIKEDNDPNRQYNYGQQIACTDTNICAFIHKFDEQVPQSKIGTLVAELVDHRCGTCGSVPLDYPSSNDIENGKLTVNYVTNPCIRKSGSNVCY